MLVFVTLHLTFDGVRLGVVIGIESFLKIYVVQNVVSFRAFVLSCVNTRFGMKRVDLRCM